MVVFYNRFEVYFDIGTSGNMTQQMSNFNFNSNRLFFVSAMFFFKWVKLSPSGIHAMSLLLVPKTMVTLYYYGRKTYTCIGPIVTYDRAYMVASVFNCIKIYILVSVKCENSTQFPKNVVFFFKLGQVVRTCVHAGYATEPNVRSMFDLEST